MEEKEKLLLAEKKNKMSEPPAQAESGDILDAFMSGLSSQLKQDTAKQLQKQLSDLHVELDKILYLLKIADPTGEAAKNRPISIEKGSNTESQHPQPVLKKAEIALPQVRKISKPERLVRGQNKPKVFTLDKPQWLRAVPGEKEKSQNQEAAVDTAEDDGFVGYKDKDC